MGRFTGRVFATLLVCGSTATAMPPCASAAQTTQYTYDALGRVISAIDANGKKVVYSYDGAGNRTRVSNGAEFAEIVPSAWSASSNAGTTGLTAANGMKDGDFDSLASIHATNSETGAWIQADLGAAKSVNHIDVAPALASSVGAAPADLNGTIIEFSLDGASWSFAAALNGVAPGATRSVAIGGVTARYIRIRRGVAGRVAVGDLRLFSSAAANSPLIAQPDSIASDGSAVTFDPRTNDQDLDGYAFAISNAEDPPHGTAVVNAGASITYTPDPGYLGADSFLYSVADGHNGTASARVTVLVRPSTNHAPVAVADNFAVSDRSNSAIAAVASLRPSANDYDADGDVLNITGHTSPSHGLLTSVGAAVIDYQPAPGYAGPDSFTYTISDGRSGSSTGTVNLTIGNADPIAGADNLAVSRSVPLTFDPRLNDSDPNGDHITVASVTSASRGTATLNGNQTITYKANVGAVGSDLFTYAISDGRGGSATGQIIMSISPNSPPAPRPDSLSTNGSVIAFDPRVNDQDVDSDPLTVVAVTAPAHGTAQIASGGGSIIYTPNSGYTGVDEFTYTVSDPEGAVGAAIVAVNGLVLDYLVVGGGGGGSYGGGGGGGVREGALVADVASLSVTVGSGGAGAPSTTSANGGAGGASSLAATQALGGGGGVLGAGAGGGAAGQGNSGGAGVANTAGGGGGGAAGAGASAIVNPSGGSAGAGGPGANSSITGTAVNYGAGGGGAGMTYLNIGNGAAGGPSAGGGVDYGSGYAGAPTRGGGGGGSVHSGGGGGSGVVVLRYLGGPKATGGTISQTGGYTVHTFTAGGSFTVTTANAAPVAVNDSIATFPDRAVTFDPRLNDTDPTGDALLVATASAPAHGSATIVGNSIRYEPEAGYSGADSFTYTLTDSAGMSATATVFVTVQLSGTYEYLVVGGGGAGGVGGGGGQSGGGGGGGGVVNSTTTLAPGAYTVTIGAGGTAGSGSSSSFGSFPTALGGGAGGSNTPGQNGASGGGASTNISAPGVGMVNQGNNGGGSFSPGAGVLSGGGGGGGATGAGGISIGERGGEGGQALLSAIAGATAAYGGGGGGASIGNTASPGGGNAGAGGTNTQKAGGAGLANRGGGGGGSAPGSPWPPGGAGGSGVVIIRYHGPQTASGGTVTTSGGYTIHTFTSSGTFTVP